MLLHAEGANGLEQKVYVSEVNYMLAKQITDLCVLMRPHFPSDLSFRQRRNAV